MEAIGAAGGNVAAVRPWWGRCVSGRTRDVGMVEPARSVPLPLTAGAVVAAVGGRLVAGDPATPVAGVSIDSRTLAPGDLFFALRGGRFDGHAFVAQALARGACGVVVEQAQEAAVREVLRPPGGAAGTAPPALIAVADTVGALQALAHAVRRASGARVVAITGSTGKTTTKEATAACLATRYRVVRNPGNLNNHIGLPLSLMALRARPDVAVVELGMNHPGEIRRLVEIADPEVRVWTNVGEVHRAFFPSVEAIADAKAEILEGAGSQTVLVANADDRRVMARVRGFRGTMVTFGIEQPAEVRAIEVRDLGLDGMAATVATPIGTVEIRTRLLGRGHLANLLAALAVALQFEITLDEVVSTVAALAPPPHRGELIRLRDGIVVVDDSYNSSPPALERMLDVLRHDRHARRRLAVLGEMRELGEQAVPLHEAGGRLAAASGLAALVAVGEGPAAALARAALAAGLAPECVAHVATTEEAARWLLPRLAPGDLVLVKGSRAIGLERLVERLQAERG